MKKIKAIGIDYSLNSPALCIASGDMSFKNCKFHYLSSKKKYIGQFDNITGISVELSALTTANVVGASSSHTMPETRFISSKF